MELEDLKKFSKNSGLQYILRNLNKITKILSKNVFIPRAIVDSLRTIDEVNERKLDLNLSTNFDNLETLISIIKTRFQEFKNIINDMESDIDRNRINIEELDKAKNNKINFYGYSENFNSPDNENIILQKTLNVNNTEVVGIIGDEDSGIEFTEHLENGKSFIKIKLEDSKIDGLNFISDSSVKINWNPILKAYEIEQNDIFRYNSNEAEDTITIQHNLSTRALDVKVFRLDPNDLDLRYPIMTGIEYPSDNQIKIYLTNKQLISVLISRI